MFRFALIQTASRLYLYNYPCIIMITVHIHNQILLGGIVAATPEYPHGAYCKINQRKFVSLESEVPSVCRLKCTAFSKSEILGYGFLII